MNVRCDRTWKCARRVVAAFAILPAVAFSFGNEDIAVSADDRVRRFGERLGDSRNSRLADDHQRLPSGLNLTARWESFGSGPLHLLGARRTLIVTHIAVRITYMPCGKLNIPAPKLVTILPDASNFITGAMSGGVAQPAPPNPPPVCRRSGRRPDRPSVAVTKIRRGTRRPRRGRLRGQDCLMRIRPSLTGLTSSCVSDVTQPGDPATVAARTLHPARCMWHVLFARIIIASTSL